MNLTEGDIFPISKQTGFQPKVIEKVIRLLDLLNVLNSHPFLKEKWALKGGTALNLFVFGIPRLSVDIDLNYIGAVDRKKMLAERPGIEKAMHAVFNRENYTVKRSPSEHAGGKWRLNYRDCSGETENIEVDLNYMFRQPLCDPIHQNSRKLGNFQAVDIPILDVHELAAGKLAALFSRCQARDLFDVYQILNHIDMDFNRLKAVFIVYGALNRKDWRTISLEEIVVEPEELKRRLVPLLHAAHPNSKDISFFIKEMMDTCSKDLPALLNFSTEEQEFLNTILDKGEIIPSLITKDSLLQSHIKNHPMLLWKAMNVRKHFGIN